MLSRSNKKKKGYGLYDSSPLNVIQNYANWYPKAFRLCRSLQLDAEKHLWVQFVIGWHNADVRGLACVSVAGDFASRKRPFYDRHHNNRQLVEVQSLCVASADIGR